MSSHNINKYYCYQELKKKISFIFNFIKFILPLLFGQDALHIFPWFQLS